jgi:hypothetical protein
MPTVSINLTDKAYQLYREWKDERKGSQRVSAAICLWNAQVLEHTYTKEAEE